MTKTTYGVISDIHQNPGSIPHLIEILRHASIDALVLNGDIGEDARMIAYTLNQVAQLGVDTYVLPGSHETVRDYTTALNHLSQRHANLIDTLTAPKVERNGHHLVFLPGSDYNAGGQYTLIPNEIPHGPYLQLKDGLAEVPPQHLQAALAHPEATHNLVYITSMNTLDKLVTDAEHTVVFCHIPPKFNDVERGIDMAYFTENQEGDVIPGVDVEQQIKQKIGNVSDDILQTIAKKYGLTLKRENRGSQDLKECYARNGIAKAISGHFHEAGHRAHDASCKPLNEGEFVDTLFFNAGPADEGKAGLVIIDDTKIAYHRITLE